MPSLASDSETQNPPPCPACGGVSFESLFASPDLLHGGPGEFLCVRCRACGVVTYKPRLSPQDLAKHYPASYYAKVPAPPSRGWKARAKRLLDEVHLGVRKGLGWRLALAPAVVAKNHFGYARHLKDAPRGRLLDIGCGDGAFLEKARLMGFECWGAEPGTLDSPCWEARGFELVRSADLGPLLDAEAPRGAIPILDASVETLRGGEGAFDAVTLNHVVEHLEDPLAALEKIRGLLAPGGRLLVRTPDADSTAFRRWARHWPGLDPPRHVHVFDRANLRLLAGRAGFEAVSEEKEMVPIHWQWALKHRLTGKAFAEPSRWDSPLLSLALIPAAALWNRLGWSDQMALWLRPKA